MAIREIRKFGDPILRRNSKVVKDFNEKLNILIDDMLDTMYKAEGVGLAAPQVGILKRVFVVDVGEGPIILVNPEVVATEGEQTDNEGCLSYPEQYYEVTRPLKATLKGYDRDGNEIEVSGEGLLARALLHENDHLNGGLFIDKSDEYHGDMFE